jgi:F420-0:gamma-glutamyl ligase
MLCIDALLCLLQNAIAVSNTTGRVTVNSRLDRERMDRAVLVVAVRDTHAAANTIQSATGQFARFCF